MSSQNVLADPQLGALRILRPYSGFTADYQGQQASKPIMMTEDGQPLDELAGQTGYDANLVRGLSVPAGARVVVWLPLLVTITNTQGYNWCFIWRYRSLADYRRDQSIPYHYPKQGVGVPQAGSPRVVIPAAWQAAAFLQTESGTVEGTNNFGLNNVYPLAVQPRGFGAANPFVPGGGTGIIEQGVSATGYGIPHYLAFELRDGSGDDRAWGDELLIGVVRDTNLDATWGFAAAEADFAFGEYFTSVTSDVGVYVSVGTGSP